MKSHYLYVYCIGRDAPSLYELQLQGIESEPVLFFTHWGLAVAFSKLSWRAGSLKKQVNEPAWVAKRVSEHEDVVEKLMRNQGILPMKFLTLFRSKRSLLNAMAPHLPELDHYLQYVQDKEEWALKVYCNESQGLKHLLETDRGLREMDRKTFQTPGGQYLHRKRLQELAREGLKNVLDGIIQDIHETLIPLSVEERDLKVHEKKITQKREDMLFNGAFLMSRKRLNIFRRRVEALKECYGPWGLLFELTGPWPPYNFCPSLEEEVKERVVT
jgi:hypothetical protein